MGRRGPAPKPSGLRLLHGSEVPAHSLEPHVPEGIPNCPEHLSDRARAIWYERAELLASMKVLTKADGDALAVYADAIANMEDIRTYFKTNPRVVELRGPDKRGNDGSVIPGKLKMAFADPRVKMEQQLLKIVMQFGDRFGLSPAARTRVQVANTNPIDDKKKKKQRFFR